MTINDLTSSNVDLMFTHFAQIEKIITSKEQPIQYNFFDADSIRLQLPKDISSQKKQTILFKYSIPVDSISSSKSCVYCLGRPERWYPLQYNDLSTHTLSVELPAKYSSLSTGNGFEIQHDKTKKFSWNDKYNFTIPLFIFKSDSLQFFSKNADKTKINFYFYTRDKTVQDNFSKIITDSFQYLNTFFGNDYPYDTYSFIEIPDYPAGSATGSLQVFGTTLISDFYTYGKLYSLKPAVHEVVHEWWGIGRIHFKDKTNDKGLQFLRESVNEYLTYMFFENYWGADSLNTCIDMAKAYYNGYITPENDKLILDIPQQFTTWEEAVIVYYKGPLIVHELRNMLGDEDWERFIKSFYATYKNKYATYNDFITVLSNYDKNSKITMTLTHFLNSKGLPEIKKE
jgi:aminopeptidase N